MSDAGSVPAWARRLLERMLPAPVAESLLGDLEETGRAGGRGRLWYGYQSLAALWSLRASRPIRHDRASNRDSRMRTFLGDLKVATRMLRHSPGFALVTLALGIGATAAMFSVLNPTLLRALPYPEADRLVMVWENPNGSRSTTSFATATDVGRLARSFESMAMMAWWQPTLDGTAGDAEVVRLFGAIALSRFLGALLYEVRPLDPVVLGFGLVLIASVALAACVVPARRALGIDPIEALRRD